MKIAFASLSNPLSDACSLVEGVRYKIAEALAASGHKVIWLCFSENARGLIEKNTDAFRVFEIQTPCRSEHSYLKRAEPKFNALDECLSSSISIYRHSQKCLDEFQPDLIDLSDQSSIGWFFALESRVPLALHYSKGELVESSSQKLEFSDSENMLISMIEMAIVSAARHYFLSDLKSQASILALATGRANLGEEQMTEIDYQSYSETQSLDSLCEQVLQAYQNCISVKSAQSQIAMSTILPEASFYLSPSVAVRYPTDASKGAFDRGFMRGRDRSPTIGAMTRALWRGVRSRWKTKTGA